MNGARGYPWMVSRTRGRHPHKAEAKVYEISISAMSLTWEKRIRHVDRPVKRRNRRILASVLRKEKHRKRQGLPTRNIPLNLVFMKFDVRLAAKKSQFSPGSEPEVLKRHYELALIRSRLLERKQAALAKIRARRVRVTDTCINLWRRRQDWLRKAEE
jgi:hypothetical protein